jgi:hypothetical protein
MLNGYVIKFQENEGKAVVEPTMIVDRGYTVMTSNIKSERRWFNSVVERQLEHSSQAY